MDYAVIYTSKTGNTQKIAMQIFEALPGNSKDIQRVEEVSGEMADMYFIGFWNDRGTCSCQIMEFLAELHGKRVALFGTCGMGESQAYFDRIANQVAALIPDDNEYIGHFLCAGKMPPQVLEKYKMLQQLDNSQMIRSMISGFEQAMLHPDEEDCRNAKKFVQRILDKQRSMENIWV